MANGSVTPQQSSRSERRVGPVPGSYDNIVEIRPKRVIRIKHINAKPRDEKFEKEMQAYLQYRENAVLGVQIPPHLLMKRQKSNAQAMSSQNNTEDTVGPNSITDHEQTGENTINNRGKPNSGQNTDSVNTSSGLNEPIDSTGVNQKPPQVTSPSRQSVQSHGVQSVSEVQVDVTRPSSYIKPMKGISETRESDKRATESPQNHPDTESHNISRSGVFTPRKTKDHRPLSGKSLRRGARSVNSNYENSDIPSQYRFDGSVTARSHKDSSFKEVTMFFIHGVGGSSDIWNSQLDFFSKLGIEVIAPDLLGHGMSQCPDVERMYHFNEHLADLEAIFDKYCKRQNVVIGHSYGCAFAAALGRRRARRVSKLVLMSGGAPIPLAPQPGIFSLPVCMLSCIKPCIFSRFERNAFHNTKKSGLSREHAFDVPVYVLSHMMQGQDWLDGDELYHQWLTSPTLLLHGKYDNFVTIGEEEDMVKTIHLCELVVIDNASHMLMMEAPGDVNQALYEFIFRDTHEPHDYDTSFSRIHSAKSNKTRLSKTLA